jgi:hypothetical protein
MQTAMRAFYCVAIGLLVAAALAADAGKASSANAARPTQDVMSLDRRLSSLEQRLFLLESNLNQLQRQLQYPPRQPEPTPARDPEVERLRLELSLLQARLGEVECGLLKLDERTLPAAVRAQMPKPTDPCRSQPGTPVSLSSRRQ